MASKTELKKLFIYSSLEEKLLLENIMNDISMLEGKSNSAIIEASIKSSLLDDDSFKSWLIRSLYCEPQIQDGIRFTLEDLYTRIESDDSMRLDPSKTKCFVEYAFSDLCFRSNNITFSDKDDAQFNHLYSYLCYILNYISNESNSFDGYELHIAPYLDTIKKWASCDPKDIMNYKDSFLSIYNLLLRTWNLTGKHPYTFRLLSLMMYFQNFSSTVRARSELRTLIKNW